MEGLINTIVALSGPADLNNLANQLKTHESSFSMQSQASLAQALHSLDPRLHSLGVLYIL